MEQRRQAPSLRPIPLGAGHLLLELEEPRSGDEHHERLGQLLDGVLEGARRLLVVDAVTTLNTTTPDSTTPADAGAALQRLHDKHPMLREEPAGRALRDAALRAPGQDRGADGAGHAHQQRVVPLEPGRVLEELRVRAKQARLLDRREQVRLQGVLGAVAGLADGQEQGEPRVPE